MPEETATTSAEPTATGGDHGAPGGPAPTPSYTPPAPAPSPASEPEKKYTDADVDRMQAKRAAEAKKAAEKAIADELGVSIADAKKLIAERQAAAEAEKTELQRANDALAAAQRDAETARNEAARLQRESLIERKLVAAGVGSGHPAEKREAVLTRARAALVLAADADAEAIDAEIANTVELIPGLIAPQGPATTPPAPSGVTSGATPPAGGQPAKTALERGRERARAATPASNTERPDPFAALRTA